MTPSFRFASGLALMALVHLAAPLTAQANVVREWNAIAVQTAVAGGNNPFQQARTLSVVQLAVFEAVNAVTGDYEPYLGTISAAAGASAEAAAIAAAHGVLKAYFPAQGPALDAARAASLDQIPNGSAKDAGIAAGVAAASAMVAHRANDGSTPLTFYEPGPAEPGLWQATPSCPVNPATGLRRGVFYNWQNVTPFAIESAAQFMPGPPPASSTNHYRKDYEEVARFGSSDSSDRSDERATVARFYAATSPSYVANSVARQLSEARGDTLSEDAQAFALINMAINDALIVSFKTKYHYLLWRPETAIVRGDEDDNDRTDPDPTYVPYVLTPCFPSYPSNHASGTGAGTEALRRLYGAAGHDITLANPAVPGVVLHYSILKTINNDVDDARVYGGIHFRFDQVGGHEVGRAVATEVVKNNLRKVH